MLKTIIKITLLIIVNYEICEASRSNFHLIHFQLCNFTQGLIKFHGNVTKEGNNYYGDGIVVTPIALDENVGVSCRIDTKVVNTYVEMFTIREKDGCKAANIYLGELWYDMQRAAQAIPGKCPMRPGRYEIHHALMDFNKISLQTFPFGTLRFTCKAIDRNHPQNNLVCIDMEVENYPN